MKLTRAQLQELLRLVAATGPGEIDCDEFLSRVGALLESRERGEAFPPELRGMSQHLELCRDCCDELQALLELGPLRAPPRDEPPSKGAPKPP